MRAFNQLTQCRLKRVAWLLLFCCVATFLFLIRIQSACGTLGPAIAPGNVRVGTVTKQRQQRQQQQVARRRCVFIDLGANWANTLRLFRDIAGDECMPGEPWEVYAFEASPLIQPYVDAFVTFLNGQGSQPVLPVPPTGSTEHLGMYARKYGCGSKGDDEMRGCMFPFFRKQLNELHSEMRGCMFRVFRKQLNELRSDPALLDPELIGARLALAGNPLQPGARSRFVFVPAAAGAKNGTLELSDVTAEQMIRGGAISTQGESHNVRVPMVNIPAWLTKNFEQEDLVVVKMDIEGAEFPILHQLLAAGQRGIGLVDTLALECHAIAGNCVELSRDLEQQRDLHLLLEGINYEGIDSLSTPDVYFPVDPRPR